MSVAEKVYETAIQDLPEAHQRRLVALIVEGLQPTPLDMDKTEGFSDEWTEEDLLDLSNATFQYVDSVYPEAPDAEYR